MSFNSDFVFALIAYPWDILPSKVLRISAKISKTKAIYIYYNYH